MTPPREECACDSAKRLGVESFSCVRHPKAMSLTPKCRTCGAEFRTYVGLGMHFSWVKKNGYHGEREKARSGQLKRAIQGMRARP
jgi:hypothetical protein